MDFATIPANTYDLGWRYSESLPEAALAALTSMAPLEEMIARFSPHRRVALAAFDIATTTIPFEELLGDPYEIEDVSTIDGLCARLDAVLRERNLRLPTEDELEAAAGGALFSWGMAVPDGIPYGNETSFTAHRQPNQFGLQLNPDPYRVEICRFAMKFGDGGVAIHGGDPWPLAWLALAPSFRLRDEDIAECFVETLETAHVRPVRLE